MKREIAQALVHFWNEAGIEAELYEDYSGRGQYGNTSTGITLESRSDLMDGMLALINDPELFIDAKDAFNADEVCRNLSQDDLGKGIILY